MVKDRDTTEEMDTMKRHLVVVTLLAPLVLASLVVLPAAEPRADGLGKRVAPFALKDTQGRTVSISEFKDRKAIAIVFLGTECPINNAYLPRLVELDREFTPKGVQFLAINSNRHDTLERVTEHARTHQLTFPVLKDSGNVVADDFGARRTPEAFVLDDGLAIRYRGCIDDQHGVGFRGPKPRRRDLAEALDDILAGRAVAVPTTAAAGCLIARVPRVREGGPVTFNKHIADILQKHCQECHRPGQIGPMPLLTYDDAVSWSDTIHEVVSERRMPPWFADPRHGKFSNDRRLPDADQTAFLAWIDGGLARGEERDLPPPRTFADGWRIGKPDVVLTMPEAFPVPAQAPRGGIPYRHFEVETKFTEDRYVERAEAREGAPSVVHHIVVYILPPGEKFRPNNPRALVLCGSAPGDMPLMLPPGTGKLVPAGSRLVFQMHYTPDGSPRTDRSSVGLIFSRHPAPRRAHTAPVFNPAFRIPPGDDNYRVESSFTFKGDAELLGFMPHMHLRGKDFLYEAEFPDGRKEVLLSVPHYNFLWQSAYRLARRRAVPQGTTIRCVAHFDNSAKNRNNPDPTQAVFWGDQTWQEMMIGWMEYLDVLKAP